MKCCNCDEAVELGPQDVEAGAPHPEGFIRHLAIRCGYCLRMFCRRCANKHFEPEWVQSGIDAIKRAGASDVSVDLQHKDGRKLTRVVIEMEERTT